MGDAKWEIGNETWEITNIAGYNSSTSIHINNADYAANGEYDDLILPTINLFNAASVNLSFNYAYCLWTDPNASQIWSDTLQVLISEDCGSTWIKIWEKAGVNLVTTTPIFNPFSWTPSTITDWDYDNINLSNYAGQDEMVIKFRNVNQYENNLFLDNINLSTNPSTNLVNLKYEDIFFPNPTKDILFIQEKGDKIIYNLLGEKIVETTSQKINMQDLKNGIYILSINGINYKIIKE